MKRKVIQQRWKKKLFALIFVVFCFGSFLFMQTRYNHVVGLVSLQRHFVSEPEVQGPKIAFLFIARNRLPLEMVWDAFFRGGDSKFSIFVHCRPGFLLNKVTTKSPYFLNRQVNNSVQIEWGEASMIEAERVLLRHALSDPLNERFVFLSDSCIPLYNFTYTYDYIMSASTSFVDSFADTKEGRYNPKMDPVIPVYNWRKGSQWAVLTRKHAKVVVEDETVFPMFQKYCKKKPLPEFWRDQYIPADTSKIHNCIPDEHYVQTLLAQKGLEAEITRRSLTHTAWDISNSRDHERRGWHPVTYKYSDATPMLLKFIKDIDNIYYETEYRREWCSSKGKASTCFLFARKFTRTAALRLLDFNRREDMGANENSSAKPRVRPIVRLGIFLISHSNIVSLVCFLAGVVALLLLPVLAKNTYISENALMPGSAYNMLSTHHVSDANKFIKDLTDLEFTSTASPIESQKLIARYMSALDAEVTFHKFYPQFSQFHPLHFFTSPDSGIISKNGTCSSFGVNTIGIIRAPRGDGKEAIVLVTPYNRSKVGLGEAVSLGIAYSVFSLLSRVTWLAKDIIWLVADSQYGEYSAVAAWLREYQAPVFHKVDAVTSEACNESSTFNELGQGLFLDGKLNGDFRRAGTMAAALVIKVAEQGDRYEDSLNIYAEATNGQMPNLDLINIVNYMAVHKQGLRIEVKKMLSLLDSWWLNTLGAIFESLGKIARSLNPQWKFGIPASEYVEGAATLASSLYYQGLGVPTGPHGAFRDYQVDAITLEISPKVSLTKLYRRNEFILRGGRLIEGVIRSINNLLEKFHQSFFLYLLTSPGKFVSVGVYMIPFALLVAPLPIVAAYLHANASNSNPQNPSSLEVDGSHKSWEWLNSARKVLVIHLWGVVVSLLPFFLRQLPNTTLTMNFVLWGFLSIFSLLILYLILGCPSAEASASQLEKNKWASLKSVTISTAFIGLSLMSVINFATAEIGALLIVPICLLARPLKLDIKARSWRTFLRASCNIALGFVVFPPVAFVLLKVAFEDFYGINAGDYWKWVESLWAWNSATYLYVGVVHLPCWALCIHILFHPC